jgi:hypothetical protein
MTKKCVYDAIDNMRMKLFLFSRWSNEQHTHRFIYLYIVRKIHTDTQEKFRSQEIGKEKNSVQKHVEKRKRCSGEDTH